MDVFAANYAFAPMRETVSVRLRRADDPSAPVVRASCPAVVIRGEANAEGAGGGGYSVRADAWTVTISRPDWPLPYSPRLGARVRLECGDELAVVDVQTCGGELILHCTRNQREGDR